MDERRGSKDENMSRMLKGNVHNCCVVPVCLYGARTQQQHRLCENDWIRRIASVKRVEGKKVLREEI